MHSQPVKYNGEEWEVRLIRNGEGLNDLRTIIWYPDVEREVRKEFGWGTEAMVNASGNMRLD